MCVWRCVCCVSRTRAVCRAHALCVCVSDSVNTHKYVYVHVHTCICVCVSQVFPRKRVLSVVARKTCPLERGRERGRVGDTRTLQRREERETVRKLYLSPLHSLFAYLAGTARDISPITFDRDHRGSGIYSPTVYF